MSAPTSAEPLVKTFGASLLGTFISAILYGVTCCLAFNYYRRYPNDRAWFKYMVAALWLLDTLHVAFSIHYVYYYLVIHDMDSSVRTSAVWSLLSANLLTVFLPFISNSFYLTRLYKIGQKNIFMIGGISLLILGRLGLELTIMVMGFVHPVFSDIARFQYLTKSYCSVSSVVDLVLAVMITWRLMKVQTANARSNKTIDLIVVYLVSTGAFTGIICLLSLFSVIFVQGGLVDVTLHAILGKLYVISVLAVLNSRQSHNLTDSTLYEASAFGVDSGFSDTRPSISLSLRSKFSQGAFVRPTTAFPGDPDSKNAGLSIYINRVNEVHTSGSSPRNTVVIPPA
ncbi:hypothetical protein DFP72DRAFT_889284 [Ephemerocybe angulata]|uniref:DUF6534 domain-containing protein n=1 Tax=Ephemerocybe angulata TaxID=980116 RepID=A0A8H6I311_9AGAR|nr:hypothetical protein DFP72DRAFT_889284 [Tulosesus angulatus]